MGNKVVSPFPTYDTACLSLNSLEINHLKSSFKIISHNAEVITQQNFLQMNYGSHYLRKHLFPRFFHTIDTKKDGIIDFEEFVSAVALFRVGSTEDKIKVLFMMYEPTKAGFLQRENLRRLLIEATLAVQKEDVTTATLEEWIEEMKELSIGMVEMALNQFGAQEGKLDFQEFVTFVKVEGSVQGLLQALPRIIDN